MTQEEMVLMMIRGVVSELPDEQRAKVNECSAKMRALIAEYGDEGKCAVVLVGAEMSTEG